MSYGFALVILIGCVLALLGVWIGSAMQALSKRIGGLALGDAIGAGSAFVLYLRPFDVDSVVLPRPKLPILSSATPEAADLVARTGVSDLSLSDRR